MSKIDDIKKEASEFVIGADVKADSFLDKLKGSKWTALILAGLVVVFLAAVFF